jgi:hypothetical protein
VGQCTLGSTSHNTSSAKLPALPHRKAEKLSNPYGFEQTRTDVFFSFPLSALSATDSLSHALLDDIHSFDIDLQLLTHFLFSHISIAALVRNSKLVIFKAATLKIRKYIIYLFCICISYLKGYIITIIME